MDHLMNPEQIKKREYLGLATLVLGVLGTLAGIVCVFVAPRTGLVLLALGVATTTAGVLVLNRIPDVVATADELW